MDDPATEHPPMPDWLADWPVEGGTEIDASVWCSPIAWRESIATDEEYQTAWRVFLERQMKADVQPGQKGK